MIFGQFTLFDLRQQPDRADSVLVHRIVVVHVELHLRVDLAEIGHELSEHPCLVHPPQHGFGIVAPCQQFEEQRVGARVFLHIGADQMRVAISLAHGFGMDLEPVGLGNLEYLDQPHRILAEPVVSRSGNPSAEHPIALVIARSGLEPGQQPAPRTAAGELLVDMGKEHAGQAADALGLQEIELHEPLDRALAGAVGEIHPLGNLSLQVEGQPVLGPVGQRVQVTAHRQHETFGAAEAAIFLCRKQADIDQFGSHPDLMDIFADPVERVEIAQATLAVFHIGFDDIAAVTHPLVARIALFQLVADEFALRPVDHFAPEAAATFFVEIAVAPDIAPFEQRGADGEIVLRHAHHIVGRAARMTDLEAEVPQEIEHRLDRLFAPRRTARGREKGDIDIGMRGHLGPSVPADSHDRELLCRRPVARRIDILDHMIMQQAHDLVDHEGVARTAFMPGGRLRLKPPGKLCTALVHRFAQQGDNGHAALLALFGVDRPDRVRQRAAIDNLPLFGYFQLGQVSTSSPPNCLRTVRLSIFWVPRRGRASCERQICSTSGTLNGARLRSRKSRSSCGDRSIPSCV